MFLDAFKDACGSLFKTMRGLIAFVLMLVVLKNYFVYFGGVPESTTVQGVTLAALVLIGIYVWATSLWVTPMILRGERPNLTRAFRQIWWRVFSVYLAFIIYAVVAYALLLLSHRSVAWFIHAGLPKNKASMLAFMVVLALPFFVFLIFSFLAVPLMILEKLAIHKAFWESVNRIRYKHFLSVFGLYALMVIAMWLASPNTRHGVFLHQYYLSFFFDTAVLLFALPLTNTIFVLFCKRMPEAL